MRIFRITSGGAAALFAALSILSPPACPAAEMVAIPGGEFVMGSPDKELRRGKDETRHRASALTAFSITPAIKDLSVNSFASHAMRGILAENIPPFLEEHHNGTDENLGNIR